MKCKGWRRRNISRPIRARAGTVDADKACIPNGIRAAAAAGIFLLLTGCAGALAGHAKLGPAEVALGYSSSLVRAEDRILIAEDRIVMETKAQARVVESINSLPALPPEIWQLLSGLAPGATALLRALEATPEERDMLLATLAAQINGGAE